MRQNTSSALPERAFEEYIAVQVDAGKSRNTIAKYRRDMSRFREFLGDAKGMDADILMQYQQHLLEEGCGTSSVNSYVGSAYRICQYYQIPVLRPESVKESSDELAKMQDELTLNEYQRLLRAAFRYDMDMVGMMLQVLAGTSLRYGEMEYITVEALKCGGIVEFERRYKSSVHKKVRLPEKLVEVLLEYAKGEDITSGILFRNRMGRFPNRSNVWRTMKRLCAFADVDPEKVSPQKIKNGFAKDFYSTIGKKVK